MYTVLRVTTEGDPAPLLVIAAAMNEAGPGIVSPRARGDGFAGDVSRSDDWGEHLTAIARLLDRHGAALSVIAGDVVIDVALDPDGPGAYTSVGLPPALAARLGALGIAFVVTAYRG